MKAAQLNPLIKHHIPCLLLATLALPFPVSDPSTSKRWITALQLLLSVLLLQDSVTRNSISNPRRLGSSLPGFVRSDAWRLWDLRAHFPALFDQRDRSRWQHEMTWKISFPLHHLYTTVRLVCWGCKVIIGNPSSSASRRGSSFSEGAVSSSASWNSFPQ